MANYVYNRVLCSEKAAEELTDFNMYPMGQYDFRETKLDSGEMELVFDTLGMEYRTEEITRFITDNKEANWYCIEENEVEQGWFRWESGKVILSVRELKYESHGCIFSYRFADNNNRPYKKLFIYSNGIVHQEDFLNNRSESWQLPEKGIEEIKKYLQSYAETLEDAYYVLPSRTESNIEEVHDYLCEELYYVMDLVGTVTPSDYAYQHDGYLRLKSGVGILKKLISFLNAVFKNADISLEIESAYSSMTDEEAECIIQENILANEQVRNENIGEEFKKRVTEYLAGIYLLWDHGVLTKREIRVPTVRMEYDKGKNALKVNYCKELRAETVLLTEYFPCENAKDTANRIFSRVESREWWKYNTFFGSDGMSIF